MDSTKSKKASSWLEFSSGQAEPLARLPPGQALAHPRSFDGGGLSLPQLQMLPGLLQVPTPREAWHSQPALRASALVQVPQGLVRALAMLEASSIVAVAKQWSGVPQAAERRQRPLRETLQYFALLCGQAVEEQAEVFVFVHEEPLPFR